MTKENPSWWDEKIDDHVAYGGNINFQGKQFVAWYLEPDSSFLDVGCGNGLLYKAIKETEKKIDYKGIDLSYKMIEAAQGMYPEVKWEVGDANKLNEADESWDVVSLFHCVECMEDYEKPIIEALRVARKKVIVAFWKGLQLRHNHIINPAPPNNWESLYCSKLFFEFLRKTGYLYAKWVESYVDGFRYNLIFILDKENKRTEISHL